MGGGQIWLPAPVEMVRGIKGRPLFRDGQDYQAWVDRLAPTAAAFRLTLLAWACLPNDAHGLLRTGPVPLATAMRRLLTGHATAFNRRHRRHGYLFRNRYRERTDEMAEFERVIALSVIDSLSEYWEVRRHQVRRLIVEAREQDYGRRAG